MCTYVLHMWYEFFAELPEGNLTVRVEKPRYALGDTVRGNCTAPPANPAANITWTVNGLPVSLLSSIVLFFACAHTLYSPGAFPALRAQPPGSASDFRTRKTGTYIYDAHVCTHTHTHTTHIGRYMTGIAIRGCNGLLRVKHIARGSAFVIAV